ncbi:MAG: type II toxin-antitoxin system HicB family antitoxin [Acidovorax sp.]
MKFPALFAPAAEGGFTVTFRDVPEAITEGDTLEEAETMALDALVTAMEFYFDDGRPVPAPSKAKAGERLVALPASVAAKVHLLNARLASKMKTVDVARAMGIKPQELARIYDLKHATKIDTIAAAMAALGLNLSVRVDPEAAYVFDTRTAENLKAIAKVKAGEPREILVVPDTDLEAEPLRAVAFIEPGDGIEWMKVMVHGNDLPMVIAAEDVPQSIEALKATRERRQAVA